MPTYKLLLLPGDGIGPEVMAEVKRLIDWINAKGIAHFETEQGLVGEEVDLVRSYRTFGSTDGGAQLNKSFQSDVSVCVGGVDPRPAQVDRPQRSRPVAYL